MAESEKKTRGRKKATKEQCEAAFRQVKNVLGLDDLWLQYGKDSGRCTVIRFDPQDPGNPEMILEGFSGNAFVDTCKGALALSYESTRHPRLGAIVSVEDTEETERPAPVVASDE